MNILVLQETDWLIRGPNTQHHIFERLSTNPLINVYVIDYDIEKLQRSKSILIKKKVFKNINRSITNSNVTIIRTAHIQVPYLRRLSSLISNFFEILRIIRKSKPDIIVSFSITNGFIGLLIAKLFRIKFIFYYIDLLHTLVPFSFAQGIAKIISNISLKKSDLVVVVTKLLKDYVIREGVHPNKVKIILNGISTENMKVDWEKFNLMKLKYHISENDFVILFMGILYDFAGLKEIIDYYNADVKNGKLKLKFFIIGDSGIYGELINHIRILKADWVIITGRIPFFDIPEYIQLADLCLLSFKINNVTNRITPVKVMEYLAMKKPVLSNSLPSVVQEIGKNKGVIFTKNQEELIKRIGELSHQKESLKDIGEKGFKFIMKNYAWSNILHDIKKIMISLIRKK